jgi:hypothetical protein
MIKIIVKSPFQILAVINYRWQNFIEEMFGMGNFSCSSYKYQQRKFKKGR